MTVHDASGGLQQSCSYVGGRPHGVMKVFVDGRCAAQHQYVQGQLHGASVAFDAAGRPSARLHYRAGQLDGPCELLHEGRRIRLSHYRAGLLEGPSTDFTTDGAVMQTCTYRANLLHGPVRRYGPGGRLIEEVHYRLGVPVGAPQRPSASGAPGAPGASTGAAQSAPSTLERLLQIVRGD
jgi:antitoxin component YwqK of YwqJK toxin-antitoxin module